ncbi:pyridoxal phosphate-dependent aminotransferase [Candidatus Peregrinibacteria bacterium CG10_big_fil_rev_8_21_14_0_10_49_24]|nr:MAG: aspartate aminotransferase [Candidatus Peregrinibacteria bacterium CG11_big_fil_rev_8_21_14_0_20_49_14]PIR51453.1 MAG: pyridoxal phosphate-dependent aminotransferase [Candidatus Peregrinibacteria bacterium CG10_big_fil_rev_8_21_14_0_10_49_24]PJA67389.1 MAG: pyridoxal phosphate-dependent aminotransferase [Candidatus Peregrinibacteria bacterium CG_4_9_14_3_um_filter_49_12]
MAISDGINGTGFPGFRPVPMTGVIYVTTKARAKGFSLESDGWANLGQGAPETGPLPGEEKGGVTSIDVSTYEYAPVAGLWELREQVAMLYNTLYRKGMSSQYTAENVAISSGGRLALTRLAAALGNIHVGHCIPDYTAYEELLTVFRAFTPMPILLKEQDGYTLSPEQLRERISGLGLGAILVSNPGNPTGQHLRGEQLRGWVDTARDCECTAIFDEFYSHYVYTDSDSEHNVVSAAQYVEDVNTDPVVIVDGLTKNWRRPGWRICWTVAPKSVIQAITSAGSFLDGGASHPLQLATVPLLQPQTVLSNAQRLQQHFSQKRDYALQRLAALNIDVAHPPQGSFYCWANLGRLPEPLRDGMRFFEAGLEEKVITVPGEFFDVNPGKRRRTAAYKAYSRISFGPSMETLRRGFDAIERVILPYI